MNSISNASNSCCSSELMAGVTLLRLDRREGVSQDRSQFTLVVSVETGLSEFLWCCDALDRTHLCLDGGPEGLTWCNLPDFRPILMGNLLYSGETLEFTASMDAQFPRNER